MIISEIEQSYTLFEWYAVDQNGHIAYFDSEAKPLPFSVSSSSEDLACITSYFENLKSISNYLITDFFLNKTKRNLEEFYNYKKTYSRSETIELINNVGVIPIVKGGIFIYSDKDIGSIQRIHGKSIIPTNPLHISQLPVNIQNILNRTKFSGRFEASDEVDVATIP